MQTDIRKKLGLALGGGGARGLAHIGVLKVFERHGISVDLLAGVSIGGVIGALYFAGHPMQEVEREVLRIGKPKELVKLVDPGFLQGGVLKGWRLANYLAEKLGAGLTFADLPKPLALVAVDLNSGQEVLLHSGLVVEALRASISVPGVFVPVERGSLRLVDGGILNNVPADVARSLGAEVVIAVDVLPDFSHNRPGEPPVVAPLAPARAPRSYSELWHVELVMVSAITQYRLAQARPEVLIRPVLPVDMDLFIGFDRAEIAIQAGEAAAEAALPAIWEALGRAAG